MKLNSFFLSGLCLVSAAAFAVNEEPAPFVAHWKGNKVAAVSYTFDDGIRDQYELAFLWLKENGLKATFFLNAGPIDAQTPTRQGAPRMTWEMVKEMSDAGMEMSNHGYTHMNHGRFPREAVEVDIATNDAVIASHTGIKPITYAYPNNTKNRQWSSAVVNAGRVGARTFQKGFGGKNTVESGRKYLDEAKRERGWFVGMTHGIAKGYDAWKDPNQLRAHLKEASQDKELWIDTFAAVSIYERLRTETTVSVTRADNVWKVTVTAPKLDKTLFAGTLDLVLGDGSIHPFDPFAGDFTVPVLKRGKSVFPGPYDPNRAKGKYLQWDEDFASAADVPDTPLKGKKIAFIGDSYVQNHKRKPNETWHFYLAQKYGMHYLNYGRNGNRLVIGTKGWGEIMLKRYTEIPKDADIIVLIAGHNDAGAIDSLNIDTRRDAAGKAMREALTPEELKARQLKFLDEFHAGVKAFIANVKRDYPKTQLVVITPWAVNRPYFSEVISILKEETAAAGVPCYDAASLSGINPNDADFRKKYFQGPNDTAHLNPAGHKLMLEKIEQFFLCLGECK